MNSQNEVLNAQRSMSVLGGTKTVCFWLMVACVLVAAGSTHSAMRGKESVLGALVTPLLLFNILALARAGTERKLRMIRAALSQ